MCFLVICICSREGLNALRVSVGVVRMESADSQVGPIFTNTNLMVHRGFQLLYHLGMYMDVLSIYILRFFLNLKVAFSKFFSDRSQNWSILQKIMAGTVIPRCFTTFEVRCFAKTMTCWSTDPRATRCKLEHTHPEKWFYIMGDNGLYGKKPAHITTYLNYWSFCIRSSTARGHHRWCAMLWTSELVTG